MSYDLQLNDPVTGECLTVDSPHQIRGGTHQMGGTNELRLNVTYNYCAILNRVILGGNGARDSIQALYGMTGAESIPILQYAISKLKDDISDDYWAPTEGNVKQGRLCTSQHLGLILSTLS